MAATTHEPWTKKTHIIPASHPRGYPRGVRDPQVSRLKLHVSQYIPYAAPDGVDTLPAITFIVQHGMAPGDNAACLEPFLSDLLVTLKGVPVRSIWAMDAATCGKSFLLNKDEIGDQTHCFDAARDVVQMVNHFQEDIKPPVIGFGQSWGAGTLLVAASWQPLLFFGIVCGDALIENGYYQWKEWGMKKGEDAHVAMMRGQYKRRRVWGSLQEVKKWWTEGKGMQLGQQYDPRVLEKILENDYRERRDGQVELLTPPSQTVALLRPDPPISGMVEDIRYEKRTEELMFPAGFWSTHPLEVREALRNVRCNVLYLWALKHSLITSAYKKRILDNTGTGFSGGGGIETGQIDQTAVNGGHSLPLFVPKETAEAVLPWIMKMWSQWHDEQEQRRKEPKIDPEKLPEEFHLKLLGKPSKL